MPKANLSEQSLDPTMPDLIGGPLVIAGAGHADEIDLAPHSHCRGQLISSTRGLLTVGVDQGTWIVPASHSVWLPPHAEHSVRSHGAFEGWGIFVEESRCDGLPAAPCVIRTSGLLREAVLRAAEWPKGSSDEQSLRIAAVIFDEIRTLPVEPFILPMPRDPRLQRVAQALLSDPADDRDLEAWARCAAASSRTLSRRFVTETGFSFTDWRQRLRLFRSLEMLATELSVTSIALDLGYATASAYISVFRRTFGETPANYRKRI